VNTVIDLLGYQITEEIYSGNRTLVYRGIKESDQQPVVIKLLRNEFLSFNELVQFRNQYTISKNLNFPSIISTYSLEPYNNSYALIMEDFGGVSLKQWIGKESGLPLRDFLEIAIDFCTTPAGVTIRAIK
jgi:serine/threonine protein kinase